MAMSARPEIEIIDLRRYRTGMELTGHRHNISYPFFWMLSVIYGAGVSLWRSFPYKAMVPPIPVISIGSIASGGTGKTPLTIYLAEKLASKSKVCVISRGWRRKSDQGLIMVSDGKRVLCDPEESGDEPYMIAKRLPQVVVVVSKDRYAAIYEALKSAKLDLAILDDGFQCREITKAMEIITLDKRAFSKSARFLPLGMMRESIRSIKPGSIIVVFDFEDNLNSKVIDQLAGDFNIFRAEVQTCVVGGENLVEIDTSRIIGEPILALSGVADPARFENTCLRIGVRPSVSIRFDDHIWYDQRNIEFILKIMKQKRCKNIITTEKDIHKLPESLRKASFVIRLSVRILEEADLLDRIRKIVGRNVC